VTDLAPVPAEPAYGSLDLTWRTCQRITQPGNEMVPKQYWSRPEAALSAILMGRELGLGDMVALQRIFVVDGKVVLAAELIRGLIRRAGHSLVYDTRTTEECTITGTRHDNGDTLTVTWTLEQARSAKLATKANWQTYPRAMLDARCTSEIARALFSDCVGWATHVPEDFTRRDDDQ
jgi:hypothetical protein